MKPITMYNWYILIKFKMLNRYHQGNEIPLQGKFVYTEEIEDVPRRQKHYVHGLTKLISQN